MLYIATFIDGYIARTDGSIDWLEDPRYALENEDYGYYDFIKSIDTTLMGNKTYQQVLGFNVPFPYPDTSNYVFTKIPVNKRDEYVEFVSGDIIEFTQNLKQMEGKDIWLIGGGQLNSAFLDNELIDEIILNIIPVTLGEGIPLFTGAAKLDTHFKLTSCKTTQTALCKQSTKSRNSVSR